jgi:hypothetical protein
MLKSPTLDPREPMDYDQYREFIQTSQRHPAEDRDAKAMLRDKTITSFTVIQHVNVAGMYHRFLWPDTAAGHEGHWKEWITDWGSHFKGWAATLPELDPRAKYSYGEAHLFRAEDVTSPDAEPKMHWTFHRL